MIACNAEFKGTELPPQSPMNIRQLNLLACGCQGCHIVDKTTDWIVGERPIDRVGSTASQSTDEDESDALVQVCVVFLVIATRLLILIDIKFRFSCDLNITSMQI